MEKINFTLALSQLEKGEIDQTYLLLGDNYYQAYFLTEQILKGKIPQGQRTYNKITISGEKATTRILEESLFGVPLFGGNQVVVLARINRLTADSQKFLIKALSSLHQSITFIGSAAKLDFRKSFSKGLAKYCKVVELRELNNTQLPGYIKSRFTAHGFNIEDKAVLEFCRVVGRDCGEIEEEIVKISCSHADKSQLTLEEIRSYLSGSRHYSQYEVAGYFAHRQKRHALHSLAKFLDSEGAAGGSRLFYTFYQQFERMLLQKKLSGSMTRENLAGRLKMNAFFLNELRKQADKYNDQELVDCLLAIYQAECDDRFSSESKRQIFERLIYKVLM